MKQKRGFILIAVVVILCMIIPVQAKGNAETNSKNKSVYYNGHTYRRYDMETNWNEAKLYCENFGGHLATITNSAEQKAVHDLLAGASFESYWLGGYADKKWQWITGEKFGYSNWAAGEPNGGLNGMRLQIYSNAGGLHSTGNRGHWDDTWGDGDHGQGIKSQGFICEWESIISTENKQGSYNGHKYQIFDGNFKTWEAAAKYCRSIGGYLAVIDDMGENKYLYNWLVSQGYMTAYFGLHDITGNGDWRDAENNPIKFFNWASGEPNDSNEVYGMFYWKYTDGKWNDAGNAADTNEAVFICEWGEKKNISESKIKVTLNANGGTFDSKNKKKDITVVSGKNYGSLPTPKRSGYNFNGWYTKKSGGSKVQASTKVTSKKKHTLYAHWAKKVISYKITLDGNGGEPKTQQYSVTYNKTYGKLPTPKRFGYNFKGWYTKNSGGNKVNANTKVTSKKKHTLYAYWEKKVISYKITLDGNGGEPKTQEYYTRADSSLPIPKRTGYIFKGWYTKKTGGEKIQPSTEIVFEKTHTLYAHWAKEKYKITYYLLNDGKNASQNPSSYTITTKKIILQSPTRKNYDFAGWYADSNFKEKVTEVAGGTTGDIALYAAWKWRQDTTEVSGSFESYVDKKKHSYKAEYSDAFFTIPTTEVIDKLAVLSMVASASAYHDSYAKKLLKNCGFQDIKYVYSSDKIKKPTKKDCDHVGYTFGYKDIKNENILVVAVLVKGTSADAEWYSNFNVGSGDVHQGFKKAADEVYAKINKEIDSLKKSIKAGKKIKFWITGHSRGAAVANLLGDMFNTKYGMENVYVYTYATPRNIKTKAIKKKWANIFNYLNPGDFITEVAPEKWGFGRYGRDIVLDSSVKSGMMEKFKQINEKRNSYGGFDKSGKESLLKSFLNLAKDQTAYNEYNWYMYINPVSFPLLYLSIKKYCYDVLAAFLGGSPSEKALAVLNATKYGNYIPRTAEVTLKMIVDGKITDRFAHAHCVDSYLAWIDAMY